MGTGLIIPSYKQGFARSAAEAANLGLWTGLQFNWHGPLGPTGLTARDTSPSNRDGTLTNMEPATAWVSSRLGSVLLFDGSNDRVVVPPALGLGSGDFTVAVWAKPTVSWLAEQYLLGMRTANNNGIRFRIDGHKLCLDIDFDDTTSALIIDNMPGVSNANDWNLFIGLRRGTSIEFYVNGVSQAIGAGGTTAADGSISTNYGIGSRAFSTPAFVLNGQIAMTAMWDIAYSSSACQSLYTDPHAIVRPMMRLLVGTTGAPPAGNRRRRMILLGTGA